VQAVATHIDEFARGRVAGGILRAGDALIEKPCQGQEREEEGGHEQDAPGAPPQRLAPLGRRGVIRCFASRDT